MATNEWAGHPQITKPDKGLKPDLYNRRTRAVYSYHFFEMHLT